MTAYRVEIICDGCGIKYAIGSPFQDIDEAVSRGEQLTECSVQDGWVHDKAADFCPTCQIKRSRGPIIDCLAISSEAA